MTCVPPGSDTRPFTIGNGGFRVRPLLVITVPVTVTVGLQMSVAPGVRIVDAWLFGSHSVLVTAGIGANVGRVVSTTVVVWRATPTPSVVLRTFSRMSFG